MGEVTQFWNLSSPSMCRDFLKKIRIGPQGACIQYLQQKNGKRVSIDEATDEQVLEVCKQFYDAAEKRPQ